MNREGLPFSKQKSSLAPYPAVDFIDNRLDSEFHPAFGRSDVTFCNELDQYVSRDGELALAKRQSQSVAVTEEMSRQRQKFESAVGEYERKCKTKTGVDLRKAHDWAEVLEAVNAAREKYEGTHEKGFCTSLRNGFRSFSSAQPAVQSWLRLLPQDSLEGSVLCGGIYIIFCAAGRLGKMRQDSYDALDQIPISISKAEALTAVYEDSRQLEAHVSKLYVAILDLLEHILEWYAKNPAKKFFGALLQADEYGAKLDEKYRQLQKFEQHVEGQAAVDQHKRLGAVDQNIKYLVESTRDSREQAAVMQNLMLRMLNSQEKQNEIFEYIAEQRRLRQEEQQQVRKKEARSLDNAVLLCKVLYYDPETALLDLEEVLRAGFTLRLNGQDRAAWILQSERVQAWLVSPRSEILYINSSEISHEPISSASLFCAMLAHALQTTKAALTLHWFCGLHPNDSVSAMLANLSGQMLVNHRVDLSQRRRAWLANINADDPEQVCQLFTSLLEQHLENSPVIIIMDGASFYEDGDRCLDMQATINELSRVAQNRGNVLKLLVTSPTRVAYIQDRAPPREILDVPSFIDGDNCGFNDAVLLSGIEKSTTAFEQRTRHLYDEEEEGSDFRNH